MSAVLERPFVLPSTGVPGASGGDAIDLDAANHVVAESLRNWDLPARVRRVVTPALAFTAEELEDSTVVLLDDDDGEPIAVAAWSEALRIDVPPGLTGYVLRGPFVVPGWQGRGLGSHLVELAVHAAGVACCDGLAVRGRWECEGFFGRLGFRPVDRGELASLRPNRFWREIL